MPRGKATISASHRNSLHLLANAMVENWSQKDNVCHVDYNPGWNLSQWLSALRAETVRIRSNTVVLYLEKAITYEDVPPLKNGLQAICKIIRQHRKGARIFIANVLPRPSRSPLGRPRVETNFMLLQAVRSVNRAIKKTHFLTIYEHFMSKRGKILRPTHKYFESNQQLTKLGCIVLRECLLRETGLKSYWFK